MRIDELRGALVTPAGPFAALDVVESTGSTNADLLAASATGAADRTVLIAERQTAGRGRRDRDWISPPGVGLYLSVLLRPGDVPAARLGSLAMVAGLALLRTAREVAGVDAALKWPNDLLAGPARGKCAGVLSEAVPPPGSAVVVGIGLNVGSVPGEVPAGPGGLVATSLAEHGASTTDLTEIAIALLTRFAEIESAWRDADGDTEISGVLASYRQSCATLGTRVRVELPGGELTGTAVDIDPTGELVVKPADGAEVRVSAGDVIHLRAE